MVYDILIVGGGIAGSTAAIYGKMAGYNVAIIEKEEIGGKLNYIDDIYNYPGFYKIKGEMLAEYLKIQLKELKIEIIYDEVKSVRKISDTFNVCTEFSTYLSKYMIISTGSEPRKIDNIKASYCEMCDGHLYKNQNVSIIGGGDAAFSCALYMSNISNTVYILMRGPEPRASKFLVDKVINKQNITVFSNVEIKEQDDDKLILNDGSTIKSDAVFVKIGSTIDLNIFNNVINDHNVFLSGDCRDERISQLIKCANDSIYAIEQIKLMSN